MYQYDIHNKMLRRHNGYWCWSETRILHKQDSLTITDRQKWQYRWHCTVLPFSTLYYLLQHCTVFYDIALHFRYYTVFYDTVLPFTILYHIPRHWYIAFIILEDGYTTLIYLHLVVNAKNINISYTPRNNVLCYVMTVIK